MRIMTDDDAAWHVADLAVARAGEERDDAAEAAAAAHDLELDRLEAEETDAWEGSMRRGDARIAELEARLAAVTAEVRRRQIKAMERWDRWANLAASGGVETREATAERRACVDRASALLHTAAELDDLLSWLKQ